MTTENCGAPFQLFRARLWSRGLAGGRHVPAMNRFSLAPRRRGATMTAKTDERTATGRPRRAGDRTHAPGGVDLDRWMAGRLIIYKYNVLVTTAHTDYQLFTGQNPVPVSRPTPRGDPTP